MQLRYSSRPHLDAPPRVHDRHVPCAACTLHVANSGCFNNNHSPFPAASLTGCPGPRPAPCPGGGTSSGVLPPEATPLPPPAHQTGCRCCSTLHMQAVGRKPGAGQGKQWMQWCTVGCCGSARVHISCLPGSLASAQGRQGQYILWLTHDNDGRRLTQAQELQHGRGQTMAYRRCEVSGHAQHDLNDSQRIFKPRCNCLTFMHLPNTQPRTHPPALCLGAQRRPSVRTPCGTSQVPAPSVAP